MPKLQKLILDSVLSPALLILWTSLLAAPLPAEAAGGPGPTISLVVAPDPPPPVRNGLNKLRVALETKGAIVREASELNQAAGEIAVVSGLAKDSGAARRLLVDLRIVPTEKPESFLIRKLEREGKTVVLAQGADPRGLMYALLEMAERVNWATRADPLFSEVRNADEQPYAPERAISMYTFNRAYWESRFYDEAYWGRYLDVLAENRFNSLVLIFGYENGGFLAPCYPYFFDLPDFPDVRMVGITAEQQQRNLAALNRLIAMAHERGLKFSVGIWDHIYRGGVQGGGIPGANEGTKKPLPHLVWGVTGENLVDYTKSALAELVRRVPSLDGIQFRMHDESGLKNSEQEAFWRDVFQMMHQAAPNLRLDLRAKGLPDSVIQSAAEAGVPFRITTKYWMEQMGLPFHPTHINKQNQSDRRHSYADMLKYPQQYKMHWRLWNGGTARVLLWADPDYARRFAESSLLYDGDGFEVNEPLCTKMEAQPHDLEPFELQPPHRRYYQYEFERYWHLYQVFGRLGYNTNTPAELWKREFERRFGKEAAPHVETALHQASRVLPRIVASCYPYRAFPMTRGWAEKQRLGDLPDYAKAEGSDVEQFANFDEEAQMLIEGGETAKIRPAANSRWLARKADVIQRAVTEAEKKIGRNRNREFDSTVTDARILAQLALFHARRIPAAVSYRLFERTKDPEALGAAITHERQAVAAWRQLVQAAGDFYHADLMMGVRTADLCGHWKDELAALEQGLAALERRLSELKPSAPPKAGPRFEVSAIRGDGDAPRVIHRPVRTAPAGKPLSIRAEVRDPAGVKWVRLRYRSVNQTQDYRVLPMVLQEKGTVFEAVIPAEHIPATWDLMYFIEAVDQDGNGRIYPDLELETPYLIVKLQR